MRAPRSRRRGASDELDGRGSRARPTTPTQLRPTRSRAQLGYSRCVYAAYMAGAMLVAFLVANVWPTRPGIGSAVEAASSASRRRRASIYRSSSAASIGVVVALYYWRKPEVRAWTRTRSPPSSKVTLAEPQGGHQLDHGRHRRPALFATVFFALLDRFWELRHRHDLQLLTSSSIADGELRSAAERRHGQEVVRHPDLLGLREQGRDALQQRIKQYSMEDEVRRDPDPDRDRHRRPAPAESSASARRPASPATSSSRWR